MSAEHRLRRIMVSAELLEEVLRSGLSAPASFERVPDDIRIVWVDWQQTYKTRNVELIVSSAAFDVCPERRDIPLWPLVLVPAVPT